MQGRELIAVVLTHQAGIYVSVWSSWRACGRSVLWRSALGSIHGSELAGAWSWSQSCTWYRGKECQSLTACSSRPSLNVFLLIKLWPETDFSGHLVFMFTERNMTWCFVVCCSRVQRFWPLKCVNCNVGASHSTRRLLEGMGGKGRRVREGHI
jgi:hypothetical protein